jgi:hypothetical protein
LPVHLPYLATMKLVIQEAAVSTTLVTIIVHPEVYIARRSKP